MEIRPALRSEAPALAALAARLFRSTYADQVPRPDIEAYIASAYTAETQAGEIEAPGGAVLVAADGSALAGYAQLRTGPPPLAGADPEALEIARFYLEPRLHGTGLAGALFAACLAWGRERALRQVWLQVWEANPRATAFYLKQGLADLGETWFQLGSQRYRDRVMTRTMDPVS